MSTRANLFATTVLAAGHKRRRLQADEVGQYLAPFRDPGSRTPQHVPLMLWADRDFAFKNDARTRWEHMLPEHRTHVLKGAGHFFQDDAGDEAAAAIRDWWSALDGADRTGG